MWPHAGLLCAKATQGLESEGADRAARGPASPVSVRRARAQWTMNCIGNGPGTSEALPKASFPVAVSVVRERQAWFQSSHALEIIHLPEASSFETHQTLESSKDILCRKLLLSID